VDRPRQSVLRLCAGGALHHDAPDFADRMLREAGVAATPGPDFDHLRGNRYMRFSFARTETDILLGIDRLARWLK
jgi:aspartate/methionine/tyrosine aminotransferase